MVKDSLTLDEIIFEMQERNPVFDILPDGIAILKKSNEIVWSNRRFQEWFPAVCENVEKKDFFQLLGQPFFTALDESEDANPILVCRQRNCRVDSVMRVTNGGRFFEISAAPLAVKEAKNENFLVVHLHEATERYEMHEKLSTLHSMCEMFSQIDCLGETLPEERLEYLREGIEYLASNQLNYEFLEMRRFDPETERLEICAHYGLTDEAVKRDIKASVHGNGTIGYVAVTRKPYFCRDTQSDPYYLCGGKDARSALTVPILFGEELLGVLNVESSVKDAFDGNDLLYLEIFNHEIALAMNVLRLLEMEKSAGMQLTLEEVHGKIAGPIRSITNRAAELHPLLYESQVEAQHKLYQLIQEVMVAQRIIREVGTKLPVVQVVKTGRLSEEKIAEWTPFFSGKRVLLVDSDLNFFNQCERVFNQLGCDLDIAETGGRALDKLAIAQNMACEYAAIPSVLRPEGYSKGTSFFYDLGQFYGEKHPPIVLLQDLCTYDTAHIIVNVTERYPARGQVGKTVEDGGVHLLKVVERTILNSAVTSPNF